MGDSIQLKVDESLQAVLEDVRKKTATKIKEIFKLEEVTIYGTLASQILAAHYLKTTQIDFRIKKSGKNKGVIEFY